MTFGSVYVHFANEFFVTLNLGLILLVDFSLQTLVFPSTAVIHAVLCVLPVLTLISLQQFYYHASFVSFQTQLF